MDEIMRRFELHRHVDETGTSGAGVVAEGVRFSDGRAALRWRSTFTSTAVYDSMQNVEAIHGHDGSTSVIWLDDDGTDADRLAVALRQIVEVADPDLRDMSYEDWVVARSAASAALARHEETNQ